MSTNLRALANSIFRKTAWLASTALVATLLVASPVSQTAAEATEAAIAPDSISVGADHACAVVDGGVKCWGSNEYGQLGYGGGASAIAVEAIAPDSGVTQVSAGGFHTCALFAYGDIQCWGKNAEGQLGNGNWNDSYQATDVVIDFQDGLVDLVGATQISAGRYHTCAVVAEGGIKCWGDNSRGQLGVDSDSSYQAIDVVVEVEVDGDPTYPPLTGANQIATGEYHTCAVVAEGGIKCWGDNKYGQLGSSPGEQPNGVDPNWGFSYAPFDVLYSRAPLTGVVQVSAGFGHTCAIVAAGKVMCWGLNTDGQRGEGAFSESSVAATQIVTSVEDPDNPGTFVENIEGNIFLAGPVFVVDDANPSGQITGATNLSAGEYHTCVVMSGGAKCWGYNDTRQLGNGTDTSSANAVEAIAAGAGVSAVAAGDEFSCALLTTEIKCWGTNRSGQLGTGGVFSQATPVTIAGVAGATALAAGEDFSCAVVSGGVKCWGNNWAGQLGNGTDADSATPVDVAGLSGVTAVTAGDNHACALLETGGVKCWGRNDNNQLGNWVYADSLVPVSVLTSVGEPLTGVTKIAAGSDHTCAIVSGSVKCWGYNSYWSQIDTSGSNRLFASPVVGLTSETAIDLGANYYSTCVVVAEGVNCLGGNFGSSTGQQLETYLAIELADATAVALGDGFMCALISGEVFCLGDNSDGQAGITAGSDVSVPVAIEAFNDQAAIDLGDGHACALSIARAVNCWGSNEFAQLGRSVGGSTHIPGVVNGLETGVTVLAVGEKHSCAIVAGLVKCWGSNASSALGLEAAGGRSATPVTATGVFGRASVVTPPTVVTSTQVIYAKPELAKFNRLSISEAGQSITLKGTNLSNIQFVFFGSKEAKVLSASDSEITLEVPAKLSGSPQIVLVTKAGTQILDGLVQIVKPYVARSLKVSSFKGNALTKEASASIRKSYLRDSSVNLVSCAAVIGEGASAKTKAATIAKSLSACKAVSGYSVKFKTFKTVLRTLDAPLKKPFVTVTFDRSKPSLVN